MNILKIARSLPAIALGFCVALVLLSFAQIAAANPSDFPPAAYCSGCTNATTSGQFLSSGVGTSTATLDAYYSGTRNTKAEKAIVLFQLDATSTVSSPTVKARVEYSMDCVEYFPASNALASNSTTTPYTGTFSELSFTLASSTDMGGTGGINAPTTTFTQSFAIDTPTRCTRVKAYGVSGGGRGNLWMMIQPAKERN